MIQEVVLSNIDNVMLYRCAYTNEFLFRYAETISELFLQSPEEYRFLTELKRYVNDASVINEDDRPIGFAFGNHKVLFQDGEIKMIQNGRMITQCKVNDFIHRPNAMFRDMMMTMKG